MAYRSGLHKRQIRPGRSGGYAQSMSGSPSTDVQSQPGEVLDVIRDVDHPSFSTHEDIGKVRVRFLNGRSRSTNSDPWAKPLTVQNRQYPVLHEIVLCQTIMGELFYNETINLYNNTNANILPSISSNDRRDDRRAGSNVDDYEQVQAGATYTTNDAPLLLGNMFASTPTIRPVAQGEGDVTYEGRLGQLIRFSSDSEFGSPTILITAGNPDVPLGTEPVEFSAARTPDTNTDSSSIFIADYSVLELSVATTSLPIHGRGNRQSNRLAGRQIVLTSGRIVLNSKMGGIYGFTAEDVVFTVGGVFNVDSALSVIVNTDADVIYTADTGKVVLTTPNVYLGSEEAVEPLVLGQQLATLLTDVLSYMKTGYKVKTAQGPSIGVTPDTLRAINAFEARVADILSLQNFTL